MNFLAPDDACPRCSRHDIPAEHSDTTGIAAYTRPSCGHYWTAAWAVPEELEDQPREDHRVREYRLLEPGRFAEPEPDLEGRYIYDDDPDW
ncbi:hypothetical protein [Streptacidiphilus sp. EB129]|uniref:hypothetical protein n=1 Tax=Streptacidiphilus sp. EB129 TaxID=3156262 RepID=UPI0035120046